MLAKQEKRQKRHKRVRAKVFGKKDRPRLCIFRSAKHLYAQLIDDGKGKIMAQASDLQIKKTKGLKKELAKELGKSIAQKAKDLKIERVVFDRGGYKYHGKVKALAEGAREGGLKF
ncbi:MAG: 50S ribosomal protein L18 [Candidatus Pacebacteria bacterium]|nr:50S ribosomal protein L18 [Candidatus Paceibacterota bacterium]